MSKLIMWNLVTLDGFFEGSKNWELPWHPTFFSDEMEQFCIAQLRTADMLVFGRVTYEGMAAYWTKATGEIADFMNRLPKLAFSRSLTKADWKNTTLIQDNAAAELKKAKKAGKGNLFVFGSAKLSADLTEAGLFDEYRLCIMPVLQGCGRRLFEREAGIKKLSLVENRPLKNGCVIVRYGSNHNT